jgi:hypothetical protein
MRLVGDDALRIAIEGMGGRGGAGVLVAAAGSGRAHGAMDDGLCDRDTLDREQEKDGQIMHGGFDRTGQRHRNHLLGRRRERWCRREKRLRSRLSRTIRLSTGPENR